MNLSQFWIESCEKYGWPTAQFLREHARTARLPIARQAYIAIKELETVESLDKQEINGILRRLSV